MRVLVAVCMILMSGAVCSRSVAEPVRDENVCPGEAVPSSLPELSYDVATIRPHAVDDGRISFSGMPHEASLTIAGISGRDLVRTAFGVQSYQVLGAPDWLSSRHFDLQAKADDAANAALAKLSNCWALRVKNQMLAAVLADRMKLAVHHETKAMSGYVLVQAKGGAKLRPSKLELDDAGNPKNTGSSMRMRSDHGASMMSAERMTPAWIAMWLSAHLGQPVEDKTGMTGSYDLSMRFASDDLRASESATGADAAPSIFTALQEQVGLKLESARVPVDVVVIDHIESPTDN